MIVYIYIIYAYISLYIYIYVYHCQHHFSIMSSKTYDQSYGVICQDFSHCCTFVITETANRLVTLTNPRALGDWKFRQGWPVLDPKLLSFPCPLWCYSCYCDAIFAVFAQVLSYYPSWSATPLEAARLVISILETIWNLKLSSSCWLRT